MKALNNILKNGKRKAGLLAAGAGIVASLGSGCIPALILFEEARNPTYKTVVVTRYIPRTAVKPVERKPVYYTAGEGTPESFVVSGKDLKDIDTNGDIIISKDEVKEQYEFNIPKGGENVYNMFFVKADKGSNVSVSVVDKKTGKVYSKTNYGVNGNLIIDGNSKNNINETEKNQKRIYQVSIDGERRKDLDKTVRYNIELE